MTSLTRPLLLVVIALCLTPTFALAQEPAIETMLQHVAQAYNLAPGSLEIVRQTSQDLPLTGQTVHLAKIINRTTGHIYGVATDDAGTIVDEAALRTAERQAYLDRYGKLSPDLFERLLQAKRSETIPILTSRAVPQLSKHVVK